MPRSTGTLTTTATGHRAPITHTGRITITRKNNKLKIRAIHTPQVKENLLSVHNLTAHGQVTFSRNRATLHQPIQLPPPIMTAQFRNGQYSLNQDATAKGARTCHRKSKPVAKTQSHAAPRTNHTPTAPTGQSRGYIPLHTQRPQAPAMRTEPAPPPKYRQTTQAQRQMSEWHLKLNHANPKTIAHMSKHRLLPALPQGLSDTSATITCSGCIHGKTARRPRKRTTHDADKGRSLSSDVCGPIKPTSPHNANYFLTVIDTKQDTFGFTT